MELTKNDVIKIIELIRVNYDNAYSGLSKDETVLLVDFWYESLKDYHKDIVFLCTKNAISACDYAPRLANIVKEIHRIQEAGSATTEQLWAELNGVLSKVYQISRYLPYSQYSQWTQKELDAIYNSLSEDVKLFVVNRSTLIEISEMSEESLQFERARFFKQMPLLRQHKNDSVAAKELIRIANGNQNVKKLKTDNN